MKKIGFITFLLFNLPALAEYRVYQYSVTNLNQSNNLSSPQIALSSLDPISYVAYNGGAQAIKIDLLDSWMCRGNTGKDKYCRSPYHMSLKNIGEQL
jgi:hypothetical protein